MVVDDNTLVIVPAPEVPTMHIPIIPGHDVPWVEPRQYANGAPVWDATDEMYITYNQEGERVLTTTGETDIWSTEHSYQRTGAATYEQLRSLRREGNGGGRRGRVGRDPGDPATAGDAPTREFAPVHADHNGHYAREGSGGGTADDHPAGRDGAHGIGRHAQHSSGRRRIPERSAAAEHRVRSHRHCPGCSGHDRVNRGGVLLFGRAVCAWLLGWAGLWGAQLGVSFAQYVILSGIAFVAAVTFRPVWREWVNAEERHAKGGRR